MDVIFVECSFFFLALFIKTLRTVRLTSCGSSHLTRSTFMQLLNYKVENSMINFLKSPKICKNLLGQKEDVLITLHTKIMRNELDNVSLGVFLF